MKILLTLLISGVLGIYIGRGYERQLKVDLEQHDLCYDTKKYEAWIAKKNGIHRCFMERREYPHRVTAAHIDYDSQE